MKTRVLHGCAQLSECQNIIEGHTSGRSTCFSTLSRKQVSCPDLTGRSDVLSYADSRLFLRERGYSLRYARLSSCLHRVRLATTPSSISRKERLEICTWGAVTDDRMFAINANRFDVQTPSTGHYATSCTTVKPPKLHPCPTYPIPKKVRNSTTPSSGIGHLHTQQALPCAVFPSTSISHMNAMKTLVNFRKGEDPGPN
ncbi:hypothetical protein K439DRAFT_81458 [Ramaria rubella]|nr:hypothetical protein K439DRAFT_81458 [Ramaria rubella]